MNSLEYVLSNRYRARTISKIIDLLKDKEGLDVNSIALELEFYYLKQQKFVYDNRSCQSNCPGSIPENMSGPFWPSHYPNGFHEHEWLMVAKILKGGFSTNITESILRIVRGYERENMKKREEGNGWVFVEPSPPEPEWMAIRWWDRVGRESVERGINARFNSKSEWMLARKNWKSS